MPAEMPRYGEAPLRHVPFIADGSAALTQGTQPRFRGIAPFAHVVRVQQDAPFDPGERLGETAQIINGDRIVRSSDRDAIQGFHGMIAGQQPVTHEGPGGARRTSLLCGSRWFLAYT